MILGFVKAIFGIPVLSIDRSPNNSVCSVVINNSIFLLGGGYQSRQITAVFPWSTSTTSRDLKTTPFKQLYFAVPEDLTLR